MEMDRSLRGYQPSNNESNNEGRKSLRNTTDIAANTYQRISSREAIREKVKVTQDTQTCVRRC